MLLNPPINGRSPLPPQLHICPPPTEEQFMDDFILFSNATGVRLSEQDFFIEGRPVNPWVLHSIVSAKNGFDSVTMNGEWSVVGVELGFPQIAWGYPGSGQWAHCSPAVAHQLQQLYQDTLRLFDQAYSCGMIDQLKNLQAPVQVQVPDQPPQPTAQPLAYQRTEADYQALLASASDRSQSSIATFENILPRFCDTSSAELEANRVPPQVIAFIEQNRENLKWLARYQQVPDDFAPTEGSQIGRQNVLRQADITAHPYRQFLQRQQQQEQQQRRADEESMRGGMMNFSLPQQQSIFASQSNLMPQRAVERLTMTQASSVSPFPFQEQSIAQQSPLDFSVIAGGMPSGTSQQQMRPIQAQDPSQGQRQETDYGLGSHMGQTLDSPKMDLSQGLQQIFYQPSLSFPQPSSAALAPQSQPGAQQVSGPGNSLSAMSLPQLRQLSSQLLQNLPTAGSSGENDIHRQLRRKVENNKRYRRMLQEIISVRTRASGDSTRPLDGVLTQTNGAPPPQSPQITRPPSQQPFLSEITFKRYFYQFMVSKGVGFSDLDLIIDDRPIDLYALYTAVFSRGGFEAVSTYDEWPVIGAALGFPWVTDRVAGRPPRCGPATAHRIQQLYNDVLAEFDPVYISSITARSRSSQESGKLPPQPLRPQAQPHQPTEEDYQALLCSITPESSVMNSEAMSILPRFAHASGADLEVHHIPPHVIAFVEQNREHLQRAVQDQNGFRAGLTSIKSELLDSRTRVNHASCLHAMALHYSYEQLRRLQRPGLVRGPGKPCTMQPSQVFVTDRPFLPLSTVRPISPSTSAQITGSNSSGGIQRDSMSVSLNPATMNGVSSGSQFTVRRPTPEELINAKRWVDEKKRVAFSCAPGLDGAYTLPIIPECDIQEYHRNVERLDLVLHNIEKYIHFAFAVLKKEEIVERMFTMMASVKVQMEELEKPNPRYVLELHTIRGMIQEVDNMDKGLKAVLARMLAHTMPPGGAPSPSQPPPQAPSAGTNAQFAPHANPDLPQGDESGPSPEGATFYRDSRLEDIKIAMGKLEI